ncbi:MAG: type III secretion inner membrane ring lipoprotein SctJ [Pseudomonadota bacterium]
MNPRRHTLRFVLAACLAALLLAGCGRQVELMAAMPEGEANEVMAALQNAGISATKVPGKEGMVGLNIDADKVGRAVDLLREKGLPRERFAGMGQVFRKEGLISSPLEERARYLYALSQELGATISQIDGVIVARVHVVLPERSATGEPAVPSSAAVFIKHQDGYSLETVQPLIRRLVTNSIPGLTADKVSIVLVNAQPAAQLRKDAPADGVAPAEAAASGGAAAVATTTAAPAAASKGGRDLVPLVVVLGLLLVASLGAAGFLAWRYWWPHRVSAAGAA